MTKQSIITLAAAASLSALITPLSAAQNPDGSSRVPSQPSPLRPNVVLFLVDDMGLMDTSVPFDTDSTGTPVRQPLNRWYRTPNMERLAQTGTRFTTFRAQSVSSPSRSSIMTGLNATRHRTTNWINAESDNRDTYGPYDWNWQGLKADDMIFPRVLSDAGYRSIHVGKAHFGNQYSEGADPARLGFDINIAGSAIGEPGSYLGENGYGLIRGYKPRAVPDLDKYHGTPTFLTDALTIEACDQVSRAVADSVPFFLNMSHYAVHYPFETDRRFIAHYPEGAKSPDARAFATLVEGQDKSLGDLIHCLDSLGVAENTLIIFLGDNGSAAPLGDKYGHTSSAPFRGKKGTEYEGGLRVPFIISWAKPDPDNPLQKRWPVKAGGVQTQPANVMDIYPTVLSAAGVKAPEGKHLDGSSLQRLASGRPDPAHSREFLMHFPHENNGRYHTVFIRGPWKLIYYYCPENPAHPEYKLFNLDTDPYEDTDLSATEPRRLTEMVRLMAARLEAEHAAYPVDADGFTLRPVIPKP